MPEPSAAELVLGPVLRRVCGTRATVWVQTSAPATVEVRAGAASGASRTFSAYGHHYALVTVAELEAGRATPYQVWLDGRVVWPAPDDRFPPCAIHTRLQGQPVRLVFGSCRKATPYVTTRFPPDALDAFARRLAGAVAAGRAEPSWPDSLVLLGDQVYADETSPAIRGWLRRRRRRSQQAPAEQVLGFDEYTRLYLESWRDPEIRWLLSTVPSTMIFDDHEVIDDWNTSQGWRDDMRGQPWWRERITAGLASYWVYQHLGNLAPDALAEDPVYAAVQAAGDATEVLARFGAAADDERSSYRWSYLLDIGRARLIVLDNRCSRQLEPGRRRILPPGEWAWLVEALHGEYDHLVIGSSLPWLLAPAIHHVEAMNEQLCESRSGPVSWLAERVRRWLDLEHWAAFTRSFEDLAAALAQLGSEGGPRRPPGSVTVLSGDVHHSYAARARLGDDVVTPVHQLVCSPVHNELPPAIKPAVRLGWSRGALWAARAVAAAAGTPAPGIGWNLVAGPFYSNAVGTLVLTGRVAHAMFEGTEADRELHRLATFELTAANPADLLPDPDLPPDRGLPPDPDRLPDPARQPAAHHPG